MPISETGGPCQYFLPLKISRPKKAPFCDFSVFVLFYVLFRNPVLAIPIVYKILSLLGLIRFCTFIYPFSEILYRYIQERARARYLFRFCLYFVHFRKYDTKIAICVLLEKKSLEKSCNKEKCCIFASQFIDTSTHNKQFYKLLLTY